MEPYHQPELGLASFRAACEEAFKIECTRTTLSLASLSWPHVWMSSEQLHSQSATLAEWLSFHTSYAQVKPSMMPPLSHWNGFELTHF